MADTVIVYALVDYDNIKINQRELSIADVESNLSFIVSTIVAACKPTIPDGGELRIRFYGGWINERGYYSQLAEWLLVSLRSIRGLHGSWRVIPDLAISLALLPDTTLRGSLRTSYPRLRQKMVDTMFAVDSIYFANQGGHLLLASDDDDMVPPTLAARKISKNFLIAIRRRPNGTAINDHICNNHGIFYTHLKGGI